MLILSRTAADADFHTKQTSYAALDTACEMVVDAAQHHGLEKVDAMPICCYYNLRAAIVYLQERKQLMNDDTVSRKIDCLVQSEKSYRGMWLLEGIGEGF